MFPRFIAIVFTLFIISLLIQCATRGRPSGGPVDKIPPEIIYTFPAIDSLGVKNLEEIKVFFSERMDENSVNKSLFISPAIDYEIDWSGGDEMTLEISSDSLKENQTYVITIGSDAQDSRRNRMKESFQFAFSTGDYLDQGKISGKIYGLSKNDIMYIYAFELSKNDTIDPRYQTAKFLTQSGEKGDYSLNYLPLKKYRLFVVEDQNKNLLLDAAYERVGIPTQDIILDSIYATKVGLDFMMTKIDTSAPFITGARAIFNNKILLRSSEELKSLSHKNITITDTSNQNKLKIKAITNTIESSSQYFLFTSPMDSAAYYKVLVKDISDTSNNKQIEPSTVFFTSNNKEDTSGFNLEYLQPPDSTINFSLYSNMKIKFSIPVDTQTVVSSFYMIKDSLDTVSGKWDWVELKEGEFKPNQGFQLDQAYNIILETSPIRSLKGDTLIDTLYNHYIQTISMDEFGSITGHVIMDTARFKQLYLFAESTRGKKQRYKARKLGQNKYIFENLFEGYYIFSGFIDLDNNKKWNAGSIEPFKYAEPVFTVNDTTRVRKRWETGEIIIPIQGW